MKHQVFSKELVAILVKAIEDKIYGSIEVYLEEGRITQITQRIINKVYRSSKEKINKKQEAVHDRSVSPTP